MCSACNCSAAVASFAQAASMARVAVLCVAVLCALAASSCVSAQPASSPGSAFGTVNAEVSFTTQLRANLTVAAVESGRSTAPIPVQQAFLNYTRGKSLAGGPQTVIIHALLSTVPSIHLSYKHPACPAIHCKRVQGLQHLAYTNVACKVFHGACLTPPSC